MKQSEKNGNKFIENIEQSGKLESNSYSRSSSSSLLNSDSAYNSHEDD